MTGGRNNAGPVLTVVIPAYNVENYIGRTIKSLTESKTDCEIEVLIVNDGSTDTTGKMADMGLQSIPESGRRQENILNC